MITEGTECHRMPWYAAQDNSVWTRTFRVTASFHAVAVLNSASDEKQEEQVTSPKNLQCSTCDGEEGPCAILKVIFFAFQEQDAALKPTLVLQGQPLHQQRRIPGQWHTAWGMRREGGRAKRKGKGKGWERVRQSEKANAGRGLTMQRTDIQSYCSRQNCAQCEHEMLVTKHITAHFWKKGEDKLHSSENESEALGWSAKT